MSWFCTTTVAVGDCETVMGVLYQRPPLTVTVLPPVTLMPTVWLVRMVLVRATALYRDSHSHRVT